MSLVNDELIDDELKILLRKKRQEKWLKLMLMLCELEDMLQQEITHFRFDEDGIIIKDGDDIIKMSL